MRDPERIDRVIEIIREIWKKNPDLRLGQLLENCELNNLYYIEDEELVKTLKDLYFKK